jgi:hypothetical protein
VNGKIIDRDRDKPSWASLGEFWLVAVESSDDGRWRRRRKDPASVNTKMVGSDRDKPGYASQTSLSLTCVDRGDFVGVRGLCASLT